MLLVINRMDILLLREHQRKMFLTTINNTHIINCHKLYHYDSAYIIYLKLFFLLFRNIKQFILGHLLQQSNLMDIRSYFYHFLILYYSFYINQMALINFLAILNYLLLLVYIFYTFILNPIGINYLIRLINRYNLFHNQIFMIFNHPLKHQ